MLIYLSTINPAWGYSSAGRALEWHSRGQRFDPAYLHQIERDVRKNLVVSMTARFFRCLRPDLMIFDRKIENHGVRFMRKITLKNTTTVEEIFKDFLISKRAKGVAEQTLESYEYHFRAIAKHLEITKDINELQKKDLEAMIAAMRESGLAANSILSYTRTLKSFFSWCNAEGFTKLNIPLYKGEETIKETYSDRELMALLKKPDMRKCSFAEYRNWVIINFLLNSGSRAATVRAILIRDVDLAQQKPQGAGHSSLQPNGFHFAGIPALPQGRRRRLFILHRDRGTTERRRSAAIHSTIQSKEGRPEDKCSSVPSYLRPQISDRLRRQRFYASKAPGAFHAGYDKALLYNLRCRYSKGVR